jgi:hypothetical protein
LKNNEKELLDNYVSDSLLEKLTKLSKGQCLLDKLNYYITVTEYRIENFLRIASKSGTFSTFLFWLNKTKGNNLNNLSSELLEDIYINSISNSDDRLYKYILNFIEKYDKLFFQKNVNVINNLINSLSCSHVPPKYQLRRIRILSQQISLIPYFNQMMKSFKSEKVLFKLHEYYYVEHHTYDSLYNLIKTLGEYTINGFIINNQTLSKLIDIMKTTEEKIYCQIITSILSNNNFDFKVIDEKIMEKIIIENYIPIINEINWTIMINSLNYNEYGKYIIHFLTKNNLVTKIIQDHDLVYWSDNKVLFFTRFLNVFSNNIELTKIIISVNYALHRLRLLARKKNKSKIIQRKVKMFNLLNDIKNFSPITNIPILSKGSHA